MHLHSQIASIIHYKLRNSIQDQVAAYGIITSARFGGHGSALETDAGLTAHTIHSALNAVLRNLARRSCSMTLFRFPARQTDLERALVYFITAQRRHIIHNRMLVDSESLSHEVHSSVWTADWGSDPCG